MTNTTQASRRPEAGTLLEVTDLRTYFRTPRGKVRAVDGVSFTLDRGLALGVVGESGSGKTVLSRSIMGLISGRNVERTGSIRFEGQELIDFSPKQMRHIWGQEMAMIFQDPMTSLNPLMKIGKQIAEPLQKHLGLSRRDAMQTAEHLLRSVKIPEAARRLDQYPHELSGGMRQRVMIAIALGLRSDAAVRRRADHGARRDRAVPDPRPHRRAAPGAQHVGDPRDPRPRRRRRAHRRDRRDVRRAPRREGADEDAVRQHEDAVHGGAAGEHPQARGPLRTRGCAPSPGARPTS